MEPFPKPLDIIVARDKSQFIHQAASFITEAAKEACAKSQSFSLALSGGKTPEAIYSALGEQPYKGIFPWTQSYFFFGDERCVPPTHDESNFAMVNRVLFSRIPIGDAHVFRFKTEMDPNEAAKTYQDALKSHFKVDLSPPQFDLVLLGLGEDGHTASLFPGTDALNEKEKWVAANQVSALGKTRLTLTFPIINNAKKVLFLCAGGAKAPVLRHVFDPHEDTLRYPVQRVQPPSGSLTWLLDRDAASRLPDGAKSTAHFL